MKKWHKESHENKTRKGMEVMRTILACSFPSSSPPLMLKVASKRGIPLPSFHHLFSTGMQDWNGKKR